MGQKANQKFKDYLELVKSVGGLKKMESLEKREELLLAAVGFDKQPTYLNHLGKTQAMMGNTQQAQKTIAEWKRSLTGDIKPKWKNAEIKLLIYQRKKKCEEEKKQWKNMNDMQVELNAAKKHGLVEETIKKWARDLDVKQPPNLFEPEEEAKMIPEQIVLPERAQAQEVESDIIPPVYEDF